MSLGVNALSNLLTSARLTLSRFFSTSLGLNV
jgi:hypothetical protein